MKDELNRDRFHEAIDKTLSGLEPDPTMAQRVICKGSGKDDMIVKKKISFGMVLAAILIMLLMATAVAAIILSSQQFVEEFAVPGAVSNDGTVGVNDSYTSQQLADMIGVLSENGITFEENSQIMQALQSGRGYYEEEFIMEVCRQAFGGNYYTWTLEQQDWFEGIMVAIGWHETHQIRLPGEDNMTYEEAEAFAYKALKASFSEDLHPEDRSIYILSRSFGYDPERPDRALWSFTLEPLDVYHGSYSVRFYDDDPVRTVFAQSVWLPDWERPYTGDEVMNAFHNIYSWFVGQWSQDVWQQLHEMMLNAQLDPESNGYAEYKGYQLTAYPAPAEDELTREEAICIAKDAMQSDRAVLDSAVLTAYEGQRTWLVGMIIYAAEEQTADDAAGNYVVSIDSHTGNVESVRKQTRNDDASMPFVPQTAYDKAREGMLTQDDYLRLAAEAIEKRYPGLDLMDPEAFDAFVNGGRRVHTIRFVSKDIHFGNASASVAHDGTVSDITVDTAPLTGDNLFQRYRSVYGYFGSWDQSIWVRMGQDAKALSAGTIDGIILLETVYPEESSVPVGHEQAQEAAMKATGKRNVEVNTCVLVDAQPHPVWIMRLLTDEAADPVMGIDAVTGEVVFTEVYKTDYTPHYVLYAMPGTWRPVAMKMLGAPVVAQREISDKFGDMELDEPEIDLFDGPWTVRQEGLTVRFEGRWAGMKSYEVELSEDGFVIRCEETETAATETYPSDLPEGTTEDDFVSVPPPQADGKPWFFGKDFADADFWVLFDARMTEYGVDAYNIRARTDEWYQQYGDMKDWPQDCIVLYTFMIATGEYDFDPWYPVFVTDGKPGQTEIYAIAADAFRSAYGSEMNPAWLENLQPAGTLDSDGMDRRTGEMFGKPVWWINMNIYDESTPDGYCIGYVQLDEDGNVLEVMLDLFSNG